eukprot:scaffold7986_cov70-Skeletonema_marinoi.AAC.3
MREVILFPRFKLHYPPKNLIVYIHKTDLYFRGFPFLDSSCIILLKTLLYTFTKQISILEAFLSSIQAELSSSKPYCIQTQNRPLISTMYKRERIVEKTIENEKEFDFEQHQHQSKIEGRSAMAMLLEH